MQNYRQSLATALASQLTLETDLVYGLLEVPPQPELGDYAFPCFKLAKELRKAPAQIAGDLASKLEEGALPEGFDRAVQTGPYLNFFLDRKAVLRDTLAELLDETVVLGASEEGVGETVLIDYSSPNIAKPFHVGHAFTTVLGEALKRLYRRLGYTVLGFNHLGDYGTQFGKLIVAYERWGNEEALEQDAITELLRIYVKFHEVAKEEPSLEDEARERFRLLEEGNETELQLWSRFRSLSLKEFQRIYERLGIEFENYNGESFYSDKIPAVVDLLAERKLLEESDGAQVVRLDEEKMPPCMILKSNGTTTYASRDLAAIMWRWNEYHFKKNLYVVGLPQSLHFRQVFSTLKRAGEPAADGCEFVGFGTVKLPGGHMSTRGGKVILLEDLLNESVDKTRQIIERNATERQLDLSAEEVAEIAEKVGLGAVQYAFLKNGRERDIVFTWEDMLDFNGETAPYLQYTYARARSILRRSGVSLEQLKEAQFELASSDAEFALVQGFRDFGQAIKQAAELNEPSMLARQLQVTARAFNSFYSHCPILNLEDEALKMARLALCEGLCRFMASGMDLLGLSVVERM